MDRNAQTVITRCKELRTYWAPRNKKMKAWYRLIQMVDELKTEQMESFVGNDPRAMYNLILHLLDSDIPHRVPVEDITDMAVATAVNDLSRFFDTAWRDQEETFRKTGPRQSQKRSIIGLLLATGWYSVFAIISDDGSRAVTDAWHPAQVYPLWGDFGLEELAHIFEVTPRAAVSMARRSGWKMERKPLSSITVYDYWWLEVSDVWPFAMVACNAVIMDTNLVKFESTRFGKIPIYIAPVGGLPDTGPLSEGVDMSTSTYNAGAEVRGDRWKEEIGQSIVATNEHIYKSWNKWWTFSLQLLRDTAQPRIFERSRSGKAIVRPEDVFRRGAIFRGGPDDSVEFIGAPPIPIELRSTQLDLEAMMQRGGVSWAMYGTITQQLTAYVMAQIAASANQIMKPFHQAIINLYEDIDNDWLLDMRERGVEPYGYKLPANIPKDVRVVAGYDIEIPGDLIQRATVARMLDPDFRLSYSYVMQKLFPEIKSYIKERAMIRSDMAEQHPTNAIIALIQHYRRQAAYLERIGDSDSARLFTLAAQAAEATITPPPPERERTAGQLPGGGRKLIGTRAEGAPTYVVPETPTPVG